MLDDRYSKEIEEKWQKEWQKYNVYKFDISRDCKKPIYSIDTPPPFTSGKLHMGHVLSYSYFDFIARYKRMKGFNVYYPQGWDCQGFPTEVKIEKKYGMRDRKEFLKHAHEWTNEMIEKMKLQMIMMGYSPDWKYEYKTISPEYHKKVQLSLLKMYETDELYNAEHPIHWCTRCGSAIAKAETNDLNRKTDFNYLKFKCKGDIIIVATTRPEMLHACVAVLFHPEDKRYAKYTNEEIETPLGKKVKLIPDKEVDKDFGTGVVMVCTFGDKQDIVWTYRYKLPIIDAFDKYGKLINAGKYDGLKTQDAKKIIIDDLTAENKIEKIEQIDQVVKVHDRCEHPIELLRSKQWFIKVKDFSAQISEDATKINWFPEFAVTYLTDWANFVEWDWVISRERILGTPIPFWYCEKCGVWVPPKEDELPVDPRLEDRNCPNCGEKMIGENSVCDCWVDSSISPLIVSKWEEDKEFFKKIYPCDLRPQGVEIIRTWAYYTLHRCKRLTGEIAFKNILLNGNVLAPDGKKMSKSLNNEIQPDEVLKEYSADALRQWAALSGAMAKDRPFSYKDIKYGKSFLTKLWNTAKFIELHIKDYDYDDQDFDNLRVVDKWILNRLHSLIIDTTNHFEKYEYHHAIKGLQEFMWHEVCDYYLEYVKYRLYDENPENEKSRRAAKYTLFNVLLNMIKMLSPFIPHITEEMYQIYYPDPAKFIVNSSWPEPYTQWRNLKAQEKVVVLNEIISQIRQYRAQKQMSMKDKIEKIIISTYAPEEIGEMVGELTNTGNIKAIEIVQGDFDIQFE
ncbi:valine--tRNA ligase [Candidatus Micrarchaeota archaeon]|nr:valine--tRNA ligase [Candidatus Micrarchaeota archaeon]